MSFFFCNFAADFVRAYEYNYCHSACGAGDSAAERGGDLAERPQFSVAAYPSKRADETG